MSQMPHSQQQASPAKKAKLGGKLRIGDHWNAISIIALSQANPLKAIAEFVENSIDAKAKNIKLIRGKRGGEIYLKIIDDGNGVPRDEAGLPDFKYVATHVCDSIKRNLKASGNGQGLQGEFGIGLLSFWTVGEVLQMASGSEDGKCYQMTMKKGDPNYTVTRLRSLLPMTGTELTITPILAGLRQLSGDKLQWYLAGELRNRLLESGVEVQIIDKVTRNEYQVKPRTFSGRRLQNIAAAHSERGAIEVEIYLADSKAENSIGLYRNGTRVLSDIAVLPEFAASPWNSGAFQGMIDVPFVHLTPGTRNMLLMDDAYADFVLIMQELGEQLDTILTQQKRAEEERATQSTIKTIQRALKDALLALPAEEYDWFDIGRSHTSGQTKGGGSSSTKVSSEADDEVHLADTTEDISALKHTDSPTEAHEEREALKFFDIAGPLYRAKIAPKSATLAVNTSRELKVLATDRSGRKVTDSLDIEWAVIEGHADLAVGADPSLIQLKAGDTPGLVRVRATVSQGEIKLDADALLTVAEYIGERPSKDQSGDTRRGIPGYTFKNAAAELWRSRYDEDRNLIVINNGHRDFVYASSTKQLKLRYICRLFAKEMVKKNFSGLNSDELLERMVELSLYTEESLK